MCPIELYSVMKASPTGVHDMHCLLTKSTQPFADSQSAWLFERPWMKSVITLCMFITQRHLFRCADSDFIKTAPMDT